MNSYTPNPEQIKSATRWFFSTFGGAIAGFAAGRGWVTPEQAVGIMSNEALVVMVGGIVTALITLVLNWLRHKEVNEVAAVAKMADDPKSPVKGVVVTPTPAGVQLIEDVGSSSVVPAGTIEAAQVVQP